MAYARSDPHMTKQTLSDILILLMLGIVVFMVNLGGYPLFDVDEPRYAETAREMLMAPGDWITPHFNWLVRFDKPAMFYWLVAAAYKLFGVSEFSARLVPACTAVLILVMLYAVVRMSIGRKPAMMTALVYITMLMTFILGRWAITDMTLTCFMTGTWLGLFLVLTRGPRWYIVAGIFGGLGLLTKGPVAIALPGLTFLVALFWFYRSQWKPILLSWWIVLGLGLSFAIALPWYAAVAKANPGTFVGSFFLFHNVKRFTDTVSGHSGGWWYYIPVILAGSMPWALFFPAMGRFFWAQRKALPPLVQYSAIWLGLVFLFFSVAGTKLLTYVLPGFPALAVLMGWFWHQAITEKSLPKQNIFWGLSVAIIALSGFAVLLLAKPLLIIPHVIQSLYHPAVTQIALWLLIITLSVAYWGFLKSKRPINGFYGLSVGMIILYAYTSLFVLPMACGMVQTDIVAFAKRAAADNMPLLTYRMKKPSLVFYSRSKVHFIAEGQPQIEPMPGTAQVLHTEPHSVYVVIKNSNMDAFQTHHPVQIVMRGAVYSLVKSRDVAYFEDDNE